MEQLALPEPVSDLIGSDEVIPITVGMSSASTFRCIGPGGDRILKVQRVDPLETTLADEAERLGWLDGFVPVPRVVETGSDASTEWLMMTALPGSDGTDPEHRRDVDALGRVLGAGLRTFHDSVPVDGCPFDARTETDVQRARARVEAGRVDPSDFEVVYQGLSASELHGLLVASIPPDTDDLVVLHGDYCVPNVILERGAITGHVDVGRAGVGDRHRDLGIACRSIAHNFGGGSVGPFVEAYGFEPLDLARLDFFVMLDEFF